MINKEKEKQKNLEYIRIKEWEEKFDIEKKTKEQEEIRREQRLNEREFEKLKKFEELENQSTNINFDFKELDVDKSTKN